MSYKGRMESGAYDGLRQELQTRIDHAVTQVESQARNGTLDQIRYYVGLRDGLATAKMILEGRNQNGIPKRLHHGPHQE